MRAIVLAGLVILAGVGCDRRDDPDVDRSSVGSSTPAGDAVDTTPDSPATLPPPAIGDADRACEGQAAGTAGCPEVDEPRVPPDPQPNQTPPQPR